MPQAPRSAIDGLLDDVAELVVWNRRAGAGAGSWSLTVWLRDALLPATRLAMAGEPGSVHVRFTTADSASLRRLLAGRDELQARLQQRVAVPELQIVIEEGEAAAGPDSHITSEPCR